VSFSILADKIYPQRPGIRQRRVMRETGGKSVTGEMGGSIVSIKSPRVTLSVRSSKNLDLQAL